MAARKVFICYSHADQEWERRLVQALAPYVREDDIDVWSDRRIDVGQDWRQAIDEQLSSASVGVVLVSASLLASSFVNDVELPAIVDAARAGRLTLIWFTVSAAGWEVTPLAQLQAAHDPRQPLDTLSPADAQGALVDIARKIAGGRSVTDLARTMTIIDDLSETTSDDHHRVQARHTGTQVQFDEVGHAGPIATITFEELAQLPSDDFALIASMQELMQNEYERWRTLRARQYELTAQERARFVEAGRIMCTELRNILDYVEYSLNKYLHDHYNGIRYSCDRLVQPPDAPGIPPT